MRSVRLVWTGVFLASLLMAPEPAILALPEEAPAEEESPVLKPEDAERLFLSFINDRASLIRSCFFLGGVKVGDITYVKNIATAEIRYRIECRQEEIDAPPLDRTLKEDFIYRYSHEVWEILGRANEVSPAVKAGAIAPSDAQAARPDPSAADRRKIAEQILAWAVLGTPPPGTDGAFPGGKLFPVRQKVLVSNENLAGVETLAVRGREVVLLTPEALLQRTVLIGGGSWLRFEQLDISGDKAEATVQVLSPVLPVPPPGGSPTRSLARLKADFFQRRGAWTMTRSRPL
ncbi:MAG TPA: hypothetical protein VFW45_05010 [Candidatus Polarisedimenticolia bacterium]|nr:hypothetical protein [Candidatus Polarisedimenticolia bacterium]